MTRSVFLARRSAGKARRGSSRRAVTEKATPSRRTPRQENRQTSTFSTPPSGRMRQAWIALL